MPVQPEADAVLDDLIAAAARVLKLRVEPAWQPAVRSHLQVTLQLAAFAAELELPDDAEPAPVFGA